MGGGWSCIFFSSHVNVMNKKVVFVYLCFIMRSPRQLLWLVWLMNRSRLSAQERMQVE